MFTFIMEGTKSKNSKQRAGGKWHDELGNCKILEMALFCMLGRKNSLMVECENCLFYANACKFFKDWILK